MLLLSKIRDGNGDSFTTNNMIAMRVRAFRYPESGGEVTTTIDGWKADLMEGGQGPRRASATVTPQRGVRSAQIRYSE